MDYDYDYDYDVENDRYKEVPNHGDDPDGATDAVIEAMLETVGPPPEEFVFPSLKVEENERVRKLQIVNFARVTVEDVTIEAMGGNVEGGYLEYDNVVGGHAVDGGDGGKIELSNKEKKDNNSRLMGSSKKGQSSMLNSSSIAGVHRVRHTKVFAVAFKDDVGVRGWLEGEVNFRVRGEIRREVKKKVKGRVKAGTVKEVRTVMEGKLR